MAEIVDEPAFRNRRRVFDDRVHAGELLARKMGAYKGRRGAYVLAIPAGGVQVAFVVSRRLGLPLDLVVTRKIHVPWNREAGFGAVSWDGLILLNEPMVSSLGLTKEDVERCVAEEKEAIRGRLRLFRGDKPFPSLKDKTAIIVDDGLASGFSMLTTVKAVKKMGAGEIVVAVPTAPVSAVELIRPHVDKIFCPNIRSGPIFAVADAYKEWHDLADGDVIDVLKQAWLNLEV
jgi:putative phosphoribosyl transferase